MEEVKRIVRSNNPFRKVHGINYLSPSSINTYIKICLCGLLGICLVLNHPSGAGAIRGIAEEFASS